jgi:DNA-binding transcriptional MerR regulator
MKISELSDRSGVSIPSIKFYLREGLLSSGVVTSPNQASYDEQHFHRLRLIRALIHIGGLPIASVRAVLDEVDSGTASLHDAFGAVMHALDAPLAGEVDPELNVVIAELHAWLRARKWKIEPHAPAVHLLAEAVLNLRRFGFSIGRAELDSIADQTEQIAELEVAYALEQSDRVAAVETMLIGTVVYGRAMFEIRRLALEAVSARLDKRTPGRGRNDK